MFRRPDALVAVIVLSTATVLGAGCSDNTQQPPRITFTSEITRGTHSAADCPENTPWLMIGSFGNPADPTQPVTPVDTGASFGQGTASVDCSVTAAGGGFDIKATASLTGAQGGAFTIQGHVTATGDQPNQSITTSYDQRPYTEQDCTVTFASTGEAVAAGRIWADFDCPNSADASLQRTCETKGTFRFENCAQ